MNLKSPVVAGALIGILAASAEGFFGVTPPVAYGICMACHANDLIGWITNNIMYGSHLAIIKISAVSSVYPVLTIVGVVAGSHIAANKHNETHCNGRFSAKMFILGMLVMVFALMAAACPTRLILRMAYGDIMAIFTFFWMVVGIIVATMILRRYRLWG